MQPIERSAKGIFLWAHRGASRKAPENTMSAFRAAELAGADGIELDVHLSRDGVPVVLHDETLDRTTSGHGPVARRTLRELRRLDAGRWFSPAFAGEPLPTLEEVFIWAKDRLRLNVEIKSPAAAEGVRLLLDRYPRIRVLVSSFDHGALERLRGDAPELPLGFLSDSFFWRRALERGGTCGAESFHPRFDTVSAPLVRGCRSRGMLVHAWTVDDPALLRRLRRRGVDGIMTNDPGRLAEGLLL